MAYVLTGRTEAERRAERRRLAEQATMPVRARPATVPKDILDRVKVWPFMSLQDACDQVADAIERGTK